MTFLVYKEEGVRIMDKVLIHNLLERYRKLFPHDPIYDDNLRCVEDGLGVTLPQDMKMISSLYDGGTFGGMPNYHLHPVTWEYDIVNRTLSLRKALCLPTKFLVLAELDESIVFLETRDSDRLDTPISWINAFDAGRFALEEPLAAPAVMTFPDFTSYFAFLVDEEEEDRAYEADLT